MRAKYGRCSLVVLLVVLTLPRPAASQESRASIIAAEQARKAADLRPYLPSKAEEALIWAKTTFITDPNGFYPFFGSVYSGGGFTLGAGYRRFYGDRTFWDAKGLYSLSNYKLLELSTDSLGHAQDRLNFHVRGGWRDATQVAFYGIGTDTPDDRSNYRFKQTYVGGDVDWFPRRWTPVRGGVTYEHYNLEPGLGAAPPVDEVHTAGTAPGLGTDPTYMHLNGSAAIDWRRSPGYSRTGGLYQITYHNYRDTEDVFSFDRVEGEIIQHIPILRENWVISLRGRVETTLDDDDVVPFFLLPSLGSGSTLRGYASGRFRDRHSLLMNAEWRWIPNRLGMDMAIFYDAGKVGPRWDDLGLFNLNRNVGIGVRFHSLVATPLRIELARGSEGLRLVFSGGAAF